MYGNKVHESVIADKRSESGITIHLVNEEYDKGRTLLQERVHIDETDTPQTLAAKIHELEYRWYPKLIEDYIKTYNKKGQ